MATLAFRVAALVDLDRILACYAGEPDRGRAHAEAIIEATSILERHPSIGRLAEGGLRELVISRGKHRFLALYRYDEQRAHVRIYRIRHQRELGYPTR